MSNWLETNRGMGVREGSETIGSKLRDGGTPFDKKNRECIQTLVRDNT